MTNILVLTPDVLNQEMAGPAIRSWEISTLLARDHNVRLVSVAGSQGNRVSRDFEVLCLTKSSELKSLVREAEVLVIQGTVTAEYPWLLKTDKKIVIDLYDPMHLELLEQAVDFPIADRAQMVSRISSVLDQQVRRADFIMCASAKQRDFWLGQLMANGRVNPYTYSSSGTLSTFLAIVPFGLSSIPPKREGHSVKGVIPGIEIDDLLIIWGGGIYNWFDPLTLVRSMSELVQRLPKARLLFLGSGHPNPSVPQMSVARDARLLAEELGILGKSVFFNDGWVPYEIRGSFLLDADLGVSTHGVHLETEFSFRTRILDYLWAGLPMVVTEGDGFAELVSDRRLGRVVKEHDANDLANAMFSILSNSTEYIQTRDRVLAVSELFYWETTLQPLVDFCSAPKFAADRLVHRPLSQSSAVFQAIDSRLRQGILWSIYRFGRRIFHAAKRFSRAR